MIETIQREIPFRKRPDLLDERAFEENMVNGFIVLMAERARDIIYGEEKAQLGFGRQEIMNQLPNEELMSIMKLRIPEFLPREHGSLKGIRNSSLIIS